MGIHSEQTDMKNSFFGESGEEINVKCIYLGYHREEYHLIRLKWYPDAVDNDAELKLVHESLITKIECGQSASELPVSIPSPEPQTLHKPSLLQKAANEHPIDVWASPALLAGLS